MSNIYLTLQMKNIEIARTTKIVWINPYNWNYRVREIETRRINVAYIICRANNICYKRSPSHRSYRSPPIVSAGP